MALKAEITIQDGKTGRSLSGDISGDATLKDLTKFTKQALIQISLETFKEERGRGFDPKPRVRVDNSFNKDIFAVNPFGKIEFIARQNVAPAIRNIYAEIQKFSPVTSGQYKASNYIFVNNQIVATDPGSLEVYLKTARFKGGEKIVFMNVTPYSARLEANGIRKGQRGSLRGKNIKRKKTGEKRGKVTARANGTYALAYRFARKKFIGISGALRFAYLPNGTDGIYIQESGVFKTSYQNTRKNRAKGQVGKPYYYPAIIITISPEGILQ